MNDQLGNFDSKDIIEVTEGEVDNQILPFLGFWKMVNRILKKASDVVFLWQQRCDILTVDSDIGYRYPNWAEEEITILKPKLYFTCESRISHRTHICSGPRTRTQGHYYRHRHRGSQDLI